MNSLIFAIAVNLMFLCQAMKPGGCDFISTADSEENRKIISRIQNMLFADPVTSKPPFVFNPKLKKDKLLGSGCFGKVYKVKYDQEQKFVAVKENSDILSVSQAKNELCINTLIKDKPGILKFYEGVVIEQAGTGSFASKKTGFLIFELAEGDLSNLVREANKRKELYYKNEYEVVNAVRQIATGLKSLHDQGYIHKDLKLDNVLIVNGVAKLGDLGCATLDNTVAHRGGNQFSMDYESLLVADEKIPNDQKPFKVYQKSTDIFALGMVMFRLLYGVFPQYKDTKIEACHATKSCKYIISKDTNSKVAEILILTLISDRNARLTVDSLISRLDAILKDKGPFTALKADLSVNIYEQFQPLTVDKLVAGNIMQDLQHYSFELSKVEKECESPDWSGFAYSSESEEKKSAGALSKQAEMSKELPSLGSKNQKSGGSEQKKSEGGAQLKKQRFLGNALRSHFKEEILNAKKTGRVLETEGGFAQVEKQTIIYSESDAGFGRSMESRIKI